MNRLLKGIIVGIGKIIPGVSGSMLAISLGIYEESIYAINNLLKKPKQSFQFLFPIGLGVLISIIFFSKIILSFLNSYYVSTILFFIGLILGGIKDIIKETKLKYSIVTLICFIVILFLEMIYKNNQLYFDNFMYLFFIGIIDAATMIIPGISGTAILMMIGCYETLISVISDLTNIENLIYNLSIIIPFGLGIMIGILLLVKLIKLLFQSYYHQTYNAILGFSLATILYMFKTTLYSSYNVYEIIIGMMTLMLGYIIAKRIN